MTDIMSATSRTLRASGPGTLNGSATQAEGNSGIRPGEGRRPTTPTSEAGIRTDPPWSVPSASAHMPAASATADPPLDPPHPSLASRGWTVCPKSGLRVLMPTSNSGVFVFPTMIAPAARSRAM